MELPQGRSDVLKDLSKTAGVDLNSLRDKYRGIASAEQAKHKATELVSPEDLAKLNNYSICKTCHGKGTVKTVYNHMVLEKDCEECDGESIIDKRTLDILKGMQ